MMLSPADWVPFRWPPTWHNAAKVDLDLIQGTPFNCAVDAPADVTEALRKNGIVVTSLDSATVTLLKDLRWPQVQTGSNGSVNAGPTGNPWVDSNGFAIQAARALVPDRPVWLAEDPPQGRILKPDNFSLAVCDAAVYGAHWLPSPDMAAWPQIVNAQKLFNAHQAWQSYHPAARLAIVSDFVGPHRALAFETLNLLTRLYVPFEIVPKSRAAAYPLVLNIDERPASTDPWQLASETHARLGRKNDLILLWIGGSLIAHYTTSPDGNSGLLHLINYATRPPGQSVTAAVMAPYSSARIYTLEHPEPIAADLHPVREGVEIYLPPFAVYAAIELTR
jgi:hypothetical protein